MERLEKYDTFSVPLGRIYYDSEFNCRGEFTMHSVADLAESIRQCGLNFPVAVRPAKDVHGCLPEGFDYHLICGHRRFRAVNYLGWESIPAMIRGGLSEREARLLNLTENLERHDLNILEEALALRRLFPPGTPTKNIARELKRTLDWVWLRLSLFTLSEQLQKYAAARMLTQNDIRALLTLPESERLASAERVIRGDRTGKFATAHQKYRAIRTKSDLNRMIECLFQAGLGGLPTRLLAWAACRVTEEQIISEIRMISEKRSVTDGIGIGDACHDCQIIWNPGFDPRRLSDSASAGDTTARRDDSGEVSPSGGEP